MSDEDWRQGLSSLPVQLRYYQTVGSTNDAALRWASSGAPEYALVVADHQSHGRGRQQRKWVTNAGAALAFSLVLRPTSEEAPRITLFSPLAAMALCGALAGYPAMQQPGRCQVKWPNDVLLDGRKAAGVLVESSWIGEQAHSVVIGMGVNVKREAVPTDEELRFPATSVEEITLVPVDRIKLLRDIIEQIMKLRGILLTDQFIERYNMILAFKGQRVFIKQDENILAGKVAGVLPNGDLLLDTGQARSVSVHVGDLYLRPQ